ncbi:MAG: DNA repair protein RecO [Bacteroidaceae bacterium]|nr:DNA repair protein RecO [Bacteroidaceae bacterium]
MLKKTKAIVLFTLKYNDSSLIVHTFTEEDGRMSFWLRIPKNSKAKVKNVLFQSLSILELDIDVSKHGLSHIKEARPISPFNSIPFDPLKLSVAIFLAEYLSKVLREETQNKSLFAYLEYSIRWLDGTKEIPANFHLVFLMRLSRFLGLYPNLENYHQGDFFDLENGCFVSTQPIHGQFVHGQQAKHILTLMRMNYTTMHLFKMNRVERNEILDMLLKYYSIHIPGSADLKSLPILKELFD